MESLLIAANITLWLVIVILGLLAYALSRQLGVLYDRVAPAGALMVNQQLAVGDPAPIVDAEKLAGTAFVPGNPRLLGSHRGRGLARMGRPQRRFHRGCRGTGGRRLTRGSSANL